MGQSRRSDPPPVTSGLPRISDIVTPGRLCRKSARRKLMRCNKSVAWPLRQLAGLMYLFTGVAHSASDPRGGALPVVSQIATAQPTSGSFDGWLCR